MSLQLLRVFLRQRASSALAELEAGMGRMLVATGPYLLHVIRDGELVRGQVRLGGCGFTGRSHG